MDISSIPSTLCPIFLRGRDGHMPNWLSRVWKVGIGDVPVTVSGALHDSAILSPHVPTVMLFKNGEVVGQKVGLPRKADLTALIDAKLN